MAGVIPPVGNFHLERRINQKGKAPMLPNDFALSWVESWVFILSFIAMIAFTITFRRLLLGRNFSMTFMTARGVLLAYILAVILALNTPKSILGRPTPAWFPVSFRSLLGVSCVGVIVLIAQRRATLNQRWIGLLIALVIGWLIYASIQHGDLTMDDWRK